MNPIRASVMWLVLCSVVPFDARAQTVPKPCEELRAKGRFRIYFDKVELEKMTQTVSDATCKTFVFAEPLQGKISVVGPENGKAEVTSDEFFKLFVLALELNGYQVEPQGSFQVISRKKAPTPK